MVPEKEAIPTGHLRFPRELDEQRRVRVLADVGQAYGEQGHVVAGRGFILPERIGGVGGDVPAVPVGEVRQRGAVAAAPCRDVPAVDHVHHWF